MDSIALILAAGKGKRMRSELPKPVVKFKNKPLVKWIVEAFFSAGINDVALVVGHGADKVKEVIGNDVTYVMQHEQKGTGHAVMEAGKTLDWHNKNIFVFVGDSPLITSNTITTLLEHHNNTNADCTFLTAEFPIKLPYARVIKDENDNLVKCVEEINATEEEKKVNELLTSHFIFKANSLFQYLEKVEANPKNGEYYLTDMIDIFLNNGLKVETKKIEGYQQLVGLNSPEDMEWAMSFEEAQN